MADEPDHTEADSEVADHEGYIDNEDTSSTASEGDPNKRRKKKKKKKKSKDSSSDAPAAEEPASSAQAAGKQASERRYNMAIEAIKQGEDMWVLLGAANIRDAKARKLADALRHSTSITSVNLSSNHIGDEGVQALTAMLKEGGASDLITLDLRDNPLTEAAEQMLEELRAVRKSLRIDTGPLTASSPPGSSSPPAGAAAAAGATPSGPSSPKGNHLPLAGKNEFKSSPIIRRYFQMGDEEEVMPTEEESEPSEEPVDPAALWDKVAQVLPEGAAAIPQLSDLLHTVCLCLEPEMPAGEMPPDGEELTPTEQFRPHIRHVLLHLEQLKQVLALTPPQVTLQHSRQPQPAVGSHRLWAVDILWFLLLPLHSTLDRLVAQAQLLPRVFQLGLSHDTSSTLHARLPQLLRNAAASKVRELWEPLFLPGLGLGLQLEGTDCPAVHTWLVNLADGAHGQAIGRRCGRIGVVVELAKVLLQVTDPTNTDVYSAPLHELLKENDLWVGSTEPGGSLHALLLEQEGELCGPRPERPEVPEGGDEGSLGGLQILSSSQLLNLFKDVTSLGG